MGNKAVVYKQKVEDNLKESYTHLNRLESAYKEIEKSYSFPISKKEFKAILDDITLMAFSDQAIYRFSKLQDTMGAKLFKSVLLSQGENVNKPFLDILNQLEKIDIIKVDEWFEIRDLRNEIAHNYDENEEIAIEVLNTIYKLKDELRKTLDAIKSIL
jgi:uncharacterized protein with HEPN domain